MSASLEPLPDPPTCEICRRPLGTAQLECPRRGFDDERRCAYQLEHGRITPGPLAVNLILGLAFIGIGAGLWLPAGGGETGFPASVFVLILALGGLFLSTWVYRKFGRRFRAVNPVTGQEIRQTSLFGVRITQTLIAPVVRAAWQGSPAREMRYPASVAELYRQGSGADLVSTALLQLIAQEAVTIGISRISKRIGRGSWRYRIVGEGASLEEIKGALEQRIYRLVLAGLPAGLPLNDLIEQLFDGGKRSPRNYLVDEIVGPEAEALGLGEVRGKVKRTLVAGPNTVGRIARDIQSIEQLYRDFWVTMPEHAQVLLAEIDQLVIMMVQTRQDERQSRSPMDSRTQ